MSRDLTPFERFHSFMKGWRCGATSGFLDEAFTKHESAEIRALYDEGYKRGLADRGKISSELCERFDYKPNILRAQSL